MRRQVKGADIASLVLDPPFDDTELSLARPSQRAALKVHLGAFDQDVGLRLDELQPAFVHAAPVQSAIEFSGEPDAHLQESSKHDQPATDLKRQLYQLRLA